MFIFIDESGVTDLKSTQQYLVVAFVLIKNRAFAEELIFEIKDKCNKKGKPINKKEIKYHNLTQLQKEIAVQVINSKFRNFYICFIDLEKAYKPIVTGEYESYIQKTMIHHVLVSLDKEELKKYEKVRIIMDKKLSIKFQDAIRRELQDHLGTKKGISVETATSGSERGVQVADLIARAFRAKLMKKSDLFEVNLTHVFQLTIPNSDEYKTLKLK